MPDGSLKNLAAATVPDVDSKALNLHQRMWAAMQDVSYIQKDKDAGSYKVVTHDAVTAKVRPALLKHGVITYPQNMVSEQNGNRTEIRCDIRFINVDRPEDFIDVPTVGYGIDSQDKGPGKALSYAVKMALLKGLMLETGLDADDGTNAEHIPPAPAESQKAAPGVTAAKTWVNGIVRELHACEDADQFMAFIEGADFMKRATKICAVYPNVWVGPEDSGLKGEMVKVGNNLEVAPGVGNWVRKIETAAKQMNSLEV